MGDIIKNLIANDFAYIKNKHVYFNVKKYAKYGNLSNKKLDENIDGIRVLVSENKIDKNDFVLWKPANIDEVGYNVDGRPYGRPGWHIECSAMAYKLLGATFDIHGGGLDLMFHHHCLYCSQFKIFFLESDGRINKQIASGRLDSQG
jgi:cysteinyl-tRNA synthetase